MIFTVRVQADNSIEIDTTSGLSEFRIEVALIKSFFLQAKKKKKGMTLINNNKRIKVHPEHEKTY